MIGVSAGDGTSDQYETDYDVTIGRPLGASTEPAGALKSSGGTQVAPQIDQKAIDELVAAAPNFANSPVIDQMTATAERSRPGELPIRGLASATQMGSDMSEVAARPKDPSNDTFIDRFGVWSIEDARQKAIQDYRIERELNNEWKGQSIIPGTPAWPNRATNVISDATPDPVRAGQQYAADESGRGSDMEGPYMHQQPYSEQHRQNLLERAPVHKGADPALNEGTYKSRRQDIIDRLDSTQEEHDKTFEDFKKGWNSMAEKYPGFKAMNPNEKPSEAGIFRIWKNVKGIQEFLKDLPEDVEAFDMNDGTVVLKKKAALTSMTDEQPDEIKAGQQYAEIGDMTEGQMKLRLGQLLRDKATTRKSGYDTEDGSYSRYNAEIRKLRDALKPGPK